MNQLVFQSMCSVVEKMVVFTIWFHTIFYVCLYIHILRLAVCWIYRIANLWIIQLETIFCCWVASFTLQNSSNNCYFRILFLWQIFSGFQAFSDSLTLVRMACLLVFTLIFLMIMDLLQEIYLCLCFWLFLEEPCFAVTVKVYCWCSRAVSE